MTKPGIVDSTRTSVTRELIESFDVSGDKKTSRSKERILELLDVATDPFDRKNYKPGHITGSAVVLSPDHQQVLLVYHPKLGMWLQPGGHVDEADTDVLEAACREAVEETGVRLELPEASPLVGMDVHKIPKNRREPKHQHHDLMFGLIAASVEVRPGREIRDVVWCDIDQIDRYGPDRALRRAIARCREVAA